MEQYIDFAARHWFLFAAFFVIFGLLVGGEIMRWRRGINAINPTQAMQLVNQEDAVLVDIRDEGDYKAGHLPAAVHLPFNELANRLKDLNKYRDRPVIVYCLTGNRADAAGVVLKKEGFNVHTLQGGFHGWQNANLPITRKKS